MRKIKKLTSVFLAALLACSVTAVSLESVSAVVDENGCYVPGDNVEATHRYYFAMPNSWLNEYTDTAGVYWWSGIDACGAVDGTGGDVSWPGYKAHRADFATDYYGMYYLDCPSDVPCIIWNNYIDGGEDEYAPVYSAAKQTNDARADYYSTFEAYDTDVYNPEWFEEMEASYNGDKSALGDYADNFFYDEEYDLGFSFNFDHMIFVAPYAPNGVNAVNNKPTYNGEWYFYYGSGEYGMYPTKADAEKYNVLHNLNENQSEIIDDPITGEGKIYFDVKKSGWNLNTNKTFYCHIWKADGSATSSGEKWPEWQVKREVCNYDADTGIATYDLTKTGHNFDVSDGKLYCVIFSSNTGMMTYNTIMSGACIGDTMYCTDVQIESPEDSEKKCSEAVWENNPDCGPEKKITSTGNIVGTAYPEGENDESLLANYLVAYYDDPDRTDLTQTLINTLMVSPDDVMSVVRLRTADSKKLKAIEEILSECTDPNKKAVGDVDGDGVLSVKDVTLIQKYLAELVMFTSDQIDIANVDGDTKVSIFDATFIQQLLVG